MEPIFQNHPAVNFNASDQRPAAANSPGHAAIQGGRRLAFYIEDFRGGGVQRMTLIIAGALAGRGHRIDLLVCEDQGPLRQQLPAHVTIRPLKAAPDMLARFYALAADPGGLRTLLRPLLLPLKLPRTLGYLPALARHLRREKPDAVFAATPYLNIVAVLARRLAQVDTRLVISERTNLSTNLKHSGAGSKDWRRRYLAPLMQRAYGMADAIVAVSDGVADDLAAHIGIPRETITRIYNPTFLPDLPRRAEEAVDHPWFAPGAPPVVLSVGRIGRQKDFPTLLRAFAQVRAQRSARLMILGESTGSDKPSERLVQLLALADELGVRDDLTFAGFVANPFAYMARAAVLVLSSLHEGFPNVLVEALACGCPVVSTDCPSGPSEILDHGEFGRLTPVGDHAAMAQAIDAALTRPPDSDRLRARAAVFSYDRAIDEYEQILLGRPTG